MNFYFNPNTGSELAYPTRPSDWRKLNGPLTWFFNPWSGAERPTESVKEDPIGNKFITEDRPLPDQGTWRYGIKGLP